MCSPAAKELLKHADLQAVDVRHGKVRVFLIVDALPLEIDISQHVKTIAGVADFSSRTVQAFPENDETP